MKKKEENRGFWLFLKLGRVWQLLACRLKWSQMAVPHSI